MARVPEVAIGEATRYARLASIDPGSKSMPTMTGAKLLAETVHGYGISHVFFMPYIAPRALMEMEKLGIKRVQTHGEKAAAYMADAYARIKRGPGLCMAQSVGAVNLAAGLQDAWLSCSPVIAITGRELQRHQLRHAYQEIDHTAPFSAVTKYSAYVSAPDELSHHLRQAFRAAVSATPGPAHVEMQGIEGGSGCRTKKRTWNSLSNRPSPKPAALSPSRRSGLH